MVDRATSLTTRTAALAWVVVVLVSGVSAVPVDETCTTQLRVDAEDRKEWFPDISKIEYKGPESRDPLSFRYYNATEMVAGRPMSEWLRFSIAFWHSMRSLGSDPFGVATRNWPWEHGPEGEEPLRVAERRMEAFFELAQKLGFKYWCFHDRDIAPEGATLEESNANLDHMVRMAARLQGETGIKVLWGTAQLFVQPRYMHGAATSPEAEVFAYAAAQVAQAMEASMALGAENYVFWGGREGYASLLNTDLALETENLARFLRMAAQHADAIGFTAQLLLEPKPHEPTMHQYDWDAATTAGFLQRHSLHHRFKLNLECNHAQLAKHTCFHETETARTLGMLGSLDANTGDPTVGWDTDQFLTDPREALLVMLSVVRAGGLAPGGINFDAKLRRESTDTRDLFLAHIGGMDAAARALRGAAALEGDGVLAAAVAERYASYNATPLGRDIVAERTDFNKLRRYALDHADPMPPSGREELYHIWLNRYI